MTEGRFISVAPKLGHVPGFDGIRGFGVMIVLVGHLLPKGYDSLNAIIDTFFVLSAFLIVSLLMQEHRSQGRIDLRKFFSRRAIRLLPNSYAVMGVWMLIWLLLSQLVIPGIDRSTATPDMLDAIKSVESIPGNVAAAALYVYHLVYPVGTGAGPLVQFWSLSVEEQFYGIAAVGVAWMLITKRRAKSVAVACVAIFVWVAISRYRADLGPWPGRTYSPSIWTRGLHALWLARPDALLVGVAAAVINARLPDPLSERAKRIITALAWVGTVGFVGVLISSVGPFVVSLGPIGQFRIPQLLPGMPWPEARSTELWCAAAKGKPMRPCDETFWFFRWGFSAMAISSAFITMGLARTRDWAVARFFGWRPFRWLGEISYSLYLWHLLVYLAVSIVLGGLADKPGGALILFVAKLGAAVAVSYTAHKQIDMRMLGRKLKYAGEATVLDRRTGKEVDVTAITKDGDTAP